MHIALISLDQHWLDKEANFSRCSQLVRLSSENNCELVIFPEMTLTGYSLNIQANIPEDVANSLTLHRFKELAHEVGVDIIFGALLFDSVSRSAQNALCIARGAGTVEVLYTKMHPFSFVGEDTVLQAGNSLGIVTVSNLRIGCSICYDLRFPELFSAMAPNCNAVVNIANWPSNRIDHWRALLTARAIENQFFVFGVNRIGADGNNLQYEESSMVIAPDGRQIKPMLEANELAVYFIDWTETECYRKVFPTMRDKRYQLYQTLYERE